MFQEILSSETLANDWRVEIADYLRNPSQKVTRKLRYKSTKYVLLDDQLYYKTVNGVLLKCLNQEESKGQSVSSECVRLSSIPRNLK